MRKKSNVEDDVDTNINPKTNSILSGEGELPSIIVYSSEKHVKYIPHEIDYIRETLRQKKFKVKLLSDETRDFSRYSDEFVKIAAECVYGVILLDGFRPNVLFEFGILLGLNKPISILISDEAFIAVKTLYENSIESGLSPKEFGKLENPKIKLNTSNHFSDLSTHISRFKTSSYMENEEHVSKKIEDSIRQKTPEIIEEFKKINSKGIDPKYLQECQNILLNILQYYMGYKKYGSEDVDQIYEQIKKFEKKSGFKMPSDPRMILASLYNSPSEKLKRSNVK